MRTLAILTALAALAACTDIDGFENDRIVEESGAYKLVITNGVCVEVDETADDDEAPLTRVNPARCGL